MLFLLSQVSARLLTPNGMTYVETDASGRVLDSYHSNSAATVQGWYRYVNSEPSLGMFTICHKPATYSPETFTFTFTWNDIPIESLSGTPANVCNQYTPSVAGLPNPFVTYFLTNPIDHKATPPAVGYQQVP